MVRIVRNPEVIQGKPTIEGTRISVELILDMVVAGMPWKEIHRDYHHLRIEEFKAAVNYATQTVQDGKYHSIAAA